jgi:DNA-binding PadR family transcriptional regulator
MRLSTQTCTLLGALLAAGTEWTHGYELSTHTGLKSGTLYPILARLHDAKWVAARWEQSGEPGRPPRHLYRLTARGRAEAVGAVAPKFARVRSFRYE